MSGSPGWSSSARTTCRPGAMMLVPARSASLRPVRPTPAAGARSDSVRIDGCSAAVPRRT
jgi:hypothetical protein